MIIIDVKYIKHTVRGVGPYNDYNQSLFKE